MLNIENLKKELPKIGDILKRIPVTTSSLISTELYHKSYDCVVVYVNENNLWYLVEFNINGHSFKQAYKLINDNSYDTKYYNGLSKELNFFKNHENLEYSGKSSIPKRNGKNKNDFKSIYELVIEIEKYNKKHKKCYTYGKYIVKVGDRYGK